MKHAGVRRALMGLGAFFLLTTPLHAQQKALPPLAEKLAAEFLAIGRLGPLGFASQGCTGTLIAPDLVLTAAHCVSATGRSTHIFAPGWQGGRGLTARRFKQELRHPEYAPKGKHGPRNDIGLIVLNAPITDIAPLPLAARDAAGQEGRAVTLAGYHVKTPDQLSGGLFCGTRAMSPGLVHVACPVVQGNSGSPILAKIGADGWQVVGVISSRIGQGAIAVQVSDWVYDQIAAHRGR